MLPQVPPEEMVAQESSQSVPLFLTSTCPVVPPAGTSFVAGSTAAVPSPRFVRAVEAVTSDRLFAVLRKAVSAKVAAVPSPEMSEVESVTAPVRPATEVTGAEVR
jgi:hypothetical protein